ncbi:MAG TPA: ATP-binding protein [Candidatus Acidoferrum sp.]|nr:ATP-binding protein [Candidatus Acidoferrum sp.]
MSNTRYAEDGAPLRQERYCSSTEYERGLMANHVAKRCSVLEDPKDRELIWFLQFISRERGLRKFAEELRAANPGELATRSMLEFGTRGKYDAEQVRKVRREIPGAHDRFLLRGESNQGERAVKLRALAEESGRNTHANEQVDATVANRPDTYEASKFAAECERGASELETLLTELCLDPACAIVSPWYFPNLITALRDYMLEWQQQQVARVVMTDIAQRVFRSLDYSVAGRCLTLTEGLEGLGKSWAALHWCLQRPGRARYVATPATDDESGFYREIAQAIGVSVAGKAREIRQRIEDALVSGDQVLVFDEAHWLFGVNSTRGGLPKRMLWVISALVNKGVPVAFVATPQFAANQKFVKEHTRWRDGQLTGRIDHHEPLPELLSQDDLAAIVRARLVQADAKAVRALVAFARTSERCLGSLNAVVKRAHFIAQQAGREVPDRADIHAAIAERCPVAVVPAPTDDKRTHVAPLPPDRSKAAPLPQSPRGGRINTPEQEEAAA